MASTTMAFAGDWEGSYGRRQDGDDQGALQQKIDLLRKKVKYVFVIFHENKSFDHYFGTYPGANGLFEASWGFTPANRTESFTQRYLDTSLTVKTIQPFLMPQAVVGAGTGRVIRSIPRTRFPSITATREWRMILTSTPGQGSRPMIATQWIRRVLTTNASGGHRDEYRRGADVDHAARSSRRPKTTSTTSIAIRSHSCGAGRSISSCLTISIRRSSARRRRTRLRSSLVSPARRSGLCTRTRARRSPTPNPNFRNPLGASYHQPRRHRPHKQRVRSGHRRPRPLPGLEP